jgi:hypothetical protein
MKQDGNKKMYIKQTSVFRISGTAQERGITVESILKMPSRV